MSQEATPFVALEFPPWIRWGQRRGASIDNAALAVTYPDHRYYQRVGDRFELAGAVRRCGWCGHECIGRRTSWCSDACSKNFQCVWSWGAVAAYVIMRDVVCQSCGCEHPGWNRSRSLIRREWHFNDSQGWVRSGRAFQAQYTMLSEWWEVDHIVPVKDGGTDDPANLRLLCHECHVTAGIEQRRARRQKVAPELAL